MTVLDRLDALRTEATPGPWRTAGNFRQNLLIGAGDAPRVYASVGRENAEFIVAAVNALPALLRIARAAEAFEACFAVPRERETFPEQFELRSALSDLEANT